MLYANTSRYESYYVFGAVTCLRIVGDDQYLQKLGCDGLSIPKLTLWRHFEIIKTLYQQVKNYDHPYLQFTLRKTNNMQYLLINYLN